MRIALIHATPLAIDPVEAAFARLWPGAERINLLDDHLSVDRTRMAGLDDDPGTDVGMGLTRRIGALADYAVAAGADGILFTCSAFGPAIDAAAARLDLPVLKPNAAMFAEALTLGPRIGLLASFPPSLAPMEAEFAATALEADKKATLRTQAAPDALTALQAGDGATHDTLLADKARAFDGVDAIMLAQFSTARAADAVAAATGLPVLTSPASAVAAMRARLGA